MVQEDLIGQAWWQFSSFQPGLFQNFVERDDEGMEEAEKLHHELRRIGLWRKSFFTFD